MASRIALPNGSIFQIAATFGAVKPITAITNAAQGVVTSAAHGLADGDLILIESGWGRIDGSAARVADADTDDFILENIDTTDPVFYAPGGGAGSLQSVLSWVEITKITAVSMSGGEQQFVTVGYLAEDNDRQYPTNRNPMSMQLTVEDQPAAAYVPIVEGYTNTKVQTVGRLTLPNKDQIIYPGFVSITDTPTLERNQIMTRTVTFSLSGRPVRYRNV
ncbi:phage tail protein [Pseudomonas sp. DTU_2021_1001937_2_SI_NGA_ILE_001]|uniref:phage tail protein n=1 Tax=Pseudomonas sp. DTU_2021_1001937_2_SI_NGA_ILE_001 TaxID=3077589 RepID=UPI0028FC2207|nr:phage tail protein [Pseudomonas sp. DTU_2021_1001937_2_SI_NGA_ILE_001]WNW10129.1 phage tail protein [Pseudomonas sp. DTU_2021_1001937_2_SI_NGA_ILE_001]